MGRIPAVEITELVIPLTKVGQRTTPEEVAVEIGEVTEMEGAVAGGKVKATEIVLEEVGMVAEGGVVEVAVEVAAVAAEIIAEEVEVVEMVETEEEIATGAEEMEEEAGETLPVEKLKSEAPLFAEKGELVVVLSAE